MIRHVKAISRQLFGAGYGYALKSVFISFVLFTSFYFGQIRLRVMPFFLFFPAFLFSFGVMIQSLSSVGHTQKFEGLFLLPYKNRKLMAAYCISFTLHTVLTKTALILSVLFAVEEWSSIEISLAVVNAVSACVAGCVFLAVRKKVEKLFVLFLCVGILALDYVAADYVYAMGLTIGVCIVMWSFLLHMDVMRFYQPYEGKRQIIRSFRKGSIVRYLLRYMFRNRIYLVNWAMMLGIAAGIPFFFGEVKEIRALAMPLSFSILCVNTPAGIVLSSNPGLETAVHLLPGQIKKFMGGYWLFLIVSSLPAYLVNLLSWQINYQCVTDRTMAEACLMFFQSIVLILMLEWFFPIQDWKVESDLWHHPRKYIVPVVMLLYAGLCQMHTIVQVFFAIFLVVEYSIIAVKMRS